MTREPPQPVRFPVEFGERSRRTIEQRFMLRFPRLAAASFALVARLSPGSRLRQAAMARGIRSAAEAYNRHDLDAVLIGWHQDLEYLPARNLVDAGLVEACYRGAAGYKAYVADAAEVWGSDTRFEPTEVIDLGERMVILANAPLRGQISGVPLTLEFAYVTTLEDGLILRQQEYHDHAEALRAVGLAE